MPGCRQTIPQKAVQVSSDGDYEDLSHPSSFSPPVNYGTGGGDDETAYVLKHSETEDCDCQDGGAAGDGDKPYGGPSQKCNSSISVVIVHVIAVGFWR